MCVGVSAGLLRRGPVVLELRHTCQRRTVLAERRGGAWYKQDRQPVALCCLLKGILCLC